MTWFGKRCLDVTYAGRTFPWCVALNVSDGPFTTDRVEAIVAAALPGSGFAWQVDWVHLYRNGRFMKGAGPTGWMTGVSTTFSTNWANYCNYPGNYRAVARVRFDTSGRGPSIYYRHDSWERYFSC